MGNATTLKMLTLFLACVIFGLAVPFGLWPSRVNVARGEEEKEEESEQAKDADSEDDDKDDKDEEDVQLTLKRIFPEKSFFGPSARATGFSFDGRYGAFLYRPYIERRHGSDLYIHDTNTGQTRRITCASRLAEFQADTRKVSDDRTKKAKKAQITLARLAGQQWHRLDGDRAVGKWTGEATHQEGKQRVTDGDCELELAIGSRGLLGGTIRIGLVSLAIDRGAITEDRLIAQLEKNSLKTKGKLSLELGEDESEGTLTLEDPKQVLQLKLARQNCDQPRKPRGIIGALGERLTLADVVPQDDADANDEKNGKRPDPRVPSYGGVQGYEWSKHAHEMLLFSDGDIYRLRIDLARWEAPVERPDIALFEEDNQEASDDEEESDEEEEGDEEQHGGRETDDDDDSNGGDQEDETDDGDDDDEEQEHEHEDEEHDSEKPTGDNETDAEQSKDDNEELEPVVPYRGDLTRLTRTRERETDVQYLPDGSGYTYLRDGALLRVSFGDHGITQLDPELKDNERMVGYQISPDQKRLVFLANRGDSARSKGRQVTIVNYRERFARATQVTRHMPDDPWPEAWTSVYLYDLAGHDSEEGTLERVFTRRLSGPRDIMRVPEWSPDSSRIAFAPYDQATGHVKILEAGFVDEDSDEKPEDEDEQDGKTEDDAEQDEDEKDADDEDQEDTDDETESSDEKEGEKQPDFKIESAKVIYQFLHAGGPNTPRMVTPQYLPDSRRLVFLTELSGFRQLHLLEPRYEQLTQLTHGRSEVYPFDISTDHATIFATATTDDPNQEQVFAIDTETGQMTRLTHQEGVQNSVAVSDNAKHVLATHSDFGRLRELVITSPADQTATPLSDSHPAEAHKLTQAHPEYFTYENRHGQAIHGHMFKPEDWTPEDRRPLLIYVYGGPLGERKMATRGAYAAPSYFFARYMTEAHGYVTATIDPRGASGYGAVFEKANFEQVGKPQTEDLVDGARWLVKHHGVDEQRMSLHGWSFGGFQTQMVMYTEPDVFAVGIAGAGPTEWHNYNSWYSTGTIGANEQGKTSLEKYSLLPLAKKLKGKLLLVHGMEDSNVLYQDTVRVYRELLKADKEVLVELFLDPSGGHGLGGDVKTIGRYRKYEDFLIRHLGKGKAAQVDEDSKEETKEHPPADTARPFRPDHAARCAKVTFWSRFGRAT